MRYFLLGALLLASCGESGEKSNTKASQDLTYSGTAMVMLDSKRELEAASKLNLNDTLNLEDGRAVDFYLSDGSSATLKGPVSGKLGQLLEVDGRVARWTQSALDVINKSADDSRMLTVRSVAGEVQWSPTGIKVPSSGTFCTQSGETPNLYLPGESSKNLQFSITSDNQSKSLIMPTGKDSQIAWPDDLPSSGDFEFENSAWWGDKSFKIVELETFDFKSLAEAGCTNQLEKFRHFTR